MIKRLEIKQASALWHIDGAEIAMFHRLNITVDMTMASIEAYRDAYKAAPTDRTTLHSVKPSGSSEALPLLPLGTRLIMKTF